MKYRTRTQDPGGVTGGAAWFRPAAVARYGPPGLLLWISCIGVVAIVVCVVGLLTTAHPSTLATVAFFAVPVVSVVSIAVLAPQGLRDLRKALASEPSLEIDGSQLRLSRPGTPPQVVEVGRVHRAQYTVRRRNQPPPLSTLHLFDHAGDEFATWDLFPLLGPAIPRWLIAQGIETTTINAGRRLHWR